MQWEYRVENVPADVISAAEIRPRELEQILNRCGSEGWELVSAFVSTHETDVIVLTFKREADAAAASSAAR